MADSDSEDIERQLDVQLQEQRDSLLAIDQALAADPSNLELLAKKKPAHAQDGDNDVKTPKVQICKFFLQERCRFGASCRFSHGIDVPLSSLRTYMPTTLESSLVGSSLWAVSQNKAKGDVWREAELESWDEKLQQGRVVFRDDASSENLGIEAIALSPYANATDEEESDSSSEQSDSTDAEDDEPQGLGFVESTALQSGIQTETAIFAKWENHTRGIASKMMAKMGYSEGMGLGLSGKGMVDPIAVKVLPPKQSLDHALPSSVDKGEKEIKAKKRSLGGKRKRGKKLAEAARAAKAEEESRPVFSLINTQLAVHGESLHQVSAKKQKGKEEKKEDR
ncbi:Zinc finger CCCH domain-containing protein [Drosera capensis]